MDLHILSQSLLLHLIVVTTSQYMPQGMPGQFPFYHQGPQMPMMQMPNAQPVMQMPHGAPMMQLPNAAPMIPHMPRLPGMPPPMPPPMHLPMSMPMGGTGRLPMVVMPHYSKKADKPRRKQRKPKRKRIKMDSSSSEGSCSESEFEYRSRNNLRTSKKRREVLTPVVSYVTKDGYVVYQKKIKKDKAKDWLELSKTGSPEFKEQVMEFKDKVKIKKREH